MRLISSFLAILADDLEVCACSGCFYSVRSLANNDAHVPAADAVHSIRPHAYLRVTVFAIFLVGLFVVAAFVSWELRKRSAHTEPDPDPIQQVEHPPPVKKVDRSGAAADLLQRGDDALLQFRPKLAIDYYEAFLEQNPSNAPFICYRLALCFESMHRHEDAVAQFRTAIQANATRPLTFACHLGLARCFLRQENPASVRRLMIPILMNEAKYRDIPPSMLVEAHHLVALSLAQQTRAAKNKKHAPHEYLAYLAVELEPAFYLDEISTYKPSSELAIEETASSKIVLQKHTEFASTILLHLSQKDGSAKATLDRLAAEAGFLPEWTPAAAKNMDDRTFQLSVGHRQLIEVMELLAEHCDVAIECQGNVLRFVSFSETNAIENRARYHQMAKRALLRALQIGTSYSRTPAIRLELGNHEASFENANEAKKWYESVLAMYPASDYALLAGYNLALAHLRNKDVTQARAAFYNVIYRAPGHELALKSQIRIGRMFLEEEKNAQALVSLRSAYILGAKSPNQALAVLTLATCHFRMEQYDKTRMLLAKERDYATKEPYRAMSIFLDAFAQYQQAKSTDSRRRESAELLNALWNQTDLDLLGPIGCLLFAQAYAELGFHDQAEKMLRQGALDRQTPLIDSMEHRMGLLLMNKQEYKQARQLFSKIAERSVTYRKQAGHQLASLDLFENRFGECTERCGRLWRDAPPADPVGLLQIWGAAFEGLGDLKRAMRCYSGKAPE
jgi:tetratricopeptide (TPR) repeat protein